MGASIGLPDLRGGEEGEVVARVGVQRGEDGDAGGAACGA